MADGETEFLILPMCKGCGHVDDARPFHGWSHFDSYWTCPFCGSCSTDARICSPGWEVHDDGLIGRIECHRYRYLLDPGPDVRPNDPRYC